MTRILGISGSLRSGSYNSALLRAAVELAPVGTTLEIASIRGIPLYDGDVEANQGIPAPVAELKERIAASDALLIVTPEYNNSVPGVLKNAIDWCTRPVSDIPRIFGGRRVTLIGASPGNFGTINAQREWLPVLRTLRMRPWVGPPLYVSHANNVFDASGMLVDPKIRERLSTLLRDFVASLG